MSKEVEAKSQQIPSDLIGYCEFLAAKTDREIRAVKWLYATSLTLIVLILGIASTCVAWFGYSSIPQIIEDKVEKEFKERDIHSVLESKVQISIEKFPLTRFGNLSGLGQSLALDAWYDKKFSLTSFRNKSEENKLIPESEIREQLQRLSARYGWITVSDDEVEITGTGEDEMNLVQRVLSVGMCKARI